MGRRRILFMNMEFPTNHMDQLDTSVRNGFQITLIKELTDVQKVLPNYNAWGERPYSEAAREIINDPQNTKIRELIWAQNYQEAAPLIIPLLLPKVAEIEQRNKEREDIQKAA